MKDAPKLWNAWNNFAYAFQVNNDVFSFCLSLRSYLKLRMHFNCGVSNLGSL